MADDFRGFPQSSEIDFGNFILEASVRIPAIFSVTMPHDFRGFLQSSEEDFGNFVPEASVSNPSRLIDYYGR
jgi:hypothetical protein